MLAEESCIHIRSKASYVPGMDHDSYMNSSKANAQYICVKTLKGIGPDDTFVSPEDCRTHRNCFKALLSRGT